MNALGKAISSLGLTQKAAAERCGVSLSAMESWLRGKPPRLSSCQKLVDHLRMSDRSIRTLNRSWPSGKRFGCWTVGRFVDTTRNEGSRFTCTCSCGNSKKLGLSGLQCGRTKSCGCQNTVRAKRTRPGATYLKIRWNEYKRSADKRGLEFSLDIKEFEALLKQDCHICGEPPSVPRGKVYQRINGVFPSNGIDRKDSKSGYTASNCFPCCSWCNRRTSNADHEDFISWLLKAAAYQQRQL